MTEIDHPGAKIITHKDNMVVSFKGQNRLRLWLAALKKKNGKNQ